MRSKGCILQASPYRRCLFWAFFAAVFGQFGDLFASAIKRWAGIKDYSRIFSEHGGMLDRLDSVLFCAPIVYAVFKIMGV